jgi:hypothetical protein
MAHPQDVWILAATLGLVKFVHEEMKAYRLAHASYLSRLV